MLTKVFQAKLTSLQEALLSLEKRTGLTKSVWVLGGRSRIRAPPALLDWKTVHEKMPWNILFLLGGGFALAKASEVTFLSYLVFVSSWLLSIWLSRQALPGHKRAHRERQTCVSPASGSRSDSTILRTPVIRASLCCCLRSWDGTTNQHDELFLEKWMIRKLPQIH